MYLFINFIKSFGLKIWDKVKDHLASYIARYILLLLGFIFLIIFFFLRKWAFTKHPLEIYGWTWLLILSIFLFLFRYFLRSILRDRGRLKNQRDIINAIDNWFSKDINGRPPIYSEGPFYFSLVEKNLNLKRGSRKYLPMVACKHGYCVESGKKTFRLAELTHKNNPMVILEPHLNKLSTGEKEITLCCNDIDRDLAWPKGATKSFLLSLVPLKNVNFGIELEDIGGDKIRIIQKD